MSDAVFLPDDFTETLEVEAKLAQGRDGSGELPKSFWETYCAFANSQGGTLFLGVKEEADGAFIAVGLRDVERIETEKLAVATAQVEGFVSNRRLQEVCRDHPHDITKMLRKLVDSKFLIPDGAGRATTYRVWGEMARDLALAPQALAGNPFSKETSSPHSAARSPDNAPRSPRNEMMSPHSDPKSPPLVEENSEEWTRMMIVGQEVRERGRSAPEKTRATILKLCEEYFLTSEQFGKRLGLRPKGVRDRFLSPLFNEGALERRFPNTPNHEQQAYRKTSH